jgi:hypothetical protein
MIGVVISARVITFSTKAVNGLVSRLDSPDLDEDGLPMA